MPLSVSLMERALGRVRGFVPGLFQSWQHFVTVPLALMQGEEACTRSGLLASGPVLGRASHPNIRPTPGHLNGHSRESSDMPNGVHSVLHNFGEVTTGNGKASELIR